MRKTWMCALAAGLAVTLLAGCGTSKYGEGEKMEKTIPEGYPIETSESLTYWIGLPGNVAASAASMNEIPLKEELKEKTGINIEFQHPPMKQEAETFNLMIASADLPDIIDYGWYNYRGGAQKAIDEQIIIPLNPALDGGIAPNLKKVYDEMPDVSRAMQTDEGNYYMFPFIRGDEILCTFRGPMIRQDLLDKAGLQAPETIEETETVLRAFRDMGIKAPLIIRLTNSYIDDTHNIIGGLGLTAGFYLDGDTVKFGCMEDKYKDFVKLLKRWYDEGLMDKEFYDEDDKRISALVSNGEAGLVWGNSGGDFGRWIPALRGKDPNAKFVPMKNLSVNKGERPKFGQKEWQYQPSGGAITTQCKNPELAARFLDFGYSEEGHMLYNFGREGESYEMKDGKPTYTDIVTNPDTNGGLSIGQGISRYARASNAGPFVQDVDYIDQYNGLQEQRDAVRAWSDTDVWDYKIPFTSMTAEESQEYSTIMRDINTMRAEELQKCIVEPGYLEANLDGLKAKLESMNIARAIQLQQGAYDRYKARK